MERSDQTGGLRKAPTGIPGFDEITHGGLPEGRTSLVVGGPGTGKTVFALQVLVAGILNQREPGIFVAFEENAEQIRTNAASFDWDLAQLEREGRLFFLDARLSPNVIQTGRFDLGGLLAALTEKAAEMGARRIVFDSIDILLSLLGDWRTERQEMYRVRDWLARAGLTGIVTTRAGQVQAEGTNSLQFLADCVVLLEQRVIDRITMRHLRVVKYRGSAFEQNEFPFVIGPDGVHVASLGTLEAAYPVSTERISTGIARLDTMLDGGYYRGSCILVTGSPGTAKTTLSGAFAQASCLRGERVLYIGFDESAAEVVRNLASVAIDLQRFIDSGLLQIHGVRSEARSAEEHLLAVTRLMDEFEPRVVVVDPFSAIARAGGRLAAQMVAQRLLHLAKLRGITILLTSLLQTHDPVIEAAEIRVSTTADAWIHLSYLSQGGERNRALVIVKARGVAHSNQVRELVLSHEGVTLADVYFAGGEVLTGTLRLEKESTERLERERSRLEHERRRRELELAETEIVNRIKALKVQLEAQRAERELLDRESRAREESQEQRAVAVRRRRRADRGGG